MEDIINNCESFIVQISTPYSTGTGFYLSDFDVIVTSESIVRDNAKVVISGILFQRQFTEVIYLDCVYDLAFLQAPSELRKIKNVIEHQFDILNEVVSLGHPFGHKYDFSIGEIIDTNKEKFGISYIEHNATLNPGYSGGPLVNDLGRIIGINTFFINSGRSIGISLPMHYISETLNKFLVGKRTPGVKCGHCHEIVFENNKDKDSCPKCKSSVQLISDIVPYEPTGMGQILEEMLAELNFDAELSRIAPNHWEIFHGSAKISIVYNDRTGLIVCDAYLCEIEKMDDIQLYEYLLRQNYEINGFSFSIKGQDIIISLLIYDQYLNKETGVRMINRLFQQADLYDNILIEQYGAKWKI